MMQRNRIDRLYMTPVHLVAPVQVYLPGFPPAADCIRAALGPQLAGNMPHLEGELIQFG